MSEKNREEVVSSEKKWPNWNEKINGRDHVITPKIKRFILLYVSKGEGKTSADFAHHFKVNVSTITAWLAYPEVKEEINRLMENNEARVIALLESRQEELVNGLLKMFKDKKVPADCRRKIAYNLLSFSRLRDVNTGRVQVVQQTAVLNKYEKMSDAELKAAMEEMDELEGA